MSESKGRRVHAALTHAPFAGFHVLLQESVDHIIELHQALVLTKIVFWFTQNIVYLPVRPSDANFTRLLERAKNLSVVKDPLNS